MADARTSTAKKLLRLAEVESHTTDEKVGAARDAVVKAEDQVKLARAAMQRFEESWKAMVCEGVSISQVRMADAQIATLRSAISEAEARVVAAEQELDQQARQATRARQAVDRAETTVSRFVKQERDRILRKRQKETDDMSSQRFSRRETS